MSQDIKIKSLLGSFSLGEHDIDLDSLGSVNMVTGQDKLVQDIQKIFSTINNHFWKDYNTDLQAVIGTNLGVNATQNMLYQKVTDALTYLKSLQDAQVQYQEVDAAEYLKRINTVLVDYLYEVTKDQADLFTYKVTVNVTNGTNQSLTVSASVNLVD